MKKISYFQGTEEPTIGKKRYKSEPKLLDQPRFKEPFYKNYDYIEDGTGNGPGAGYTSLQSYKSVEDFLKAKRKRNKDKYRADDMIQQDDGSFNKVKQANRINVLKKLAIDFPADEINNPILSDNDGSSSYSSSVGIGGQLDKYLPLNDFEGKSPDKLDFGRDYVNQDNSQIPSISEILDQVISPSETNIYGLPNGIVPQADLDADKTIDTENPYYGKTDFHTDDRKTINII